MDLGEVGRAVSSAKGRPAEPQRRTQHEQAQTPANDTIVGPSMVQLPTDPTTRLERDSLMAMLQHPESIGIDLVRRASQSRYSNPSLAVVSEGITGALGSPDGPAAFASTAWLDRVVAEVPLPYANLVKELGVAPIPEKENRELTIYCRGIASGMVDRDLLRQKTELLGALQRTDAVAEPQRHRELQVELVRIEAERRILRGD
jgi:DNA primase